MILLIKTAIDILIITYKVKGLIYYIKFYQDDYL